MTKITGQRAGHSRRDFIKASFFLLSGAMVTPSLYAFNAGNTPAFALKPIGRSFALADYYIWCSSPIWGDDDKVHLFYSRWKKEKGMSGWIRGSEIAHAVAERPDAPFKDLGVVLRPREGYWDSTTCHNPLIQKVGDTYYLFYMGNSNGKTDTKRIGIATSKSLDGPWERLDSPTLMPGEKGAWDDHCTTNPAFVKGNDGKYWLFYKSWNTAEYQNQSGSVRGNRKYGLAKADHPQGPYLKVSENPVIDFSDSPNNAQLEDAFVWKEAGMYYMIARDMGFYNHEFGLLLSSPDGLRWSEPQVSYLDMKSYVQESDPPAHLKRFGRLERPMLLLDKHKGTPCYLFGATQGGTAETSTTFVFEIESYTL
ncbi:glycoside hydrolase family protein [Sphingobacterium arenae]|nr:glycoside hydrolase family protein [Sphingobacterium arenae]